MFLMIRSRNKIIMNMERLLAQSSHIQIQIFNLKETSIEFKDINYY